ncbi:hypothetical protein H0H81_010738 [Sphagnurus paluster]|uniref:non-specific serine/threonine protein kinase n=1 Tax=Sphagnurus paluster TaxID=117069 RepID=A0A9P7GIW1_9AGAR|nr:hypothetical protein H0H81_010738 [Sphagnurus paluster]
MHYRSWTRLLRPLINILRKITSYTRRQVGPVPQRHRYSNTTAPVCYTEDSEDISVHAWSASDAPVASQNTVADLCAHLGRQLPIQVVKLIARDVLRALEDLHKMHGMAYCDLGLNNIVLSSRDMRGIISQPSVNSQLSLFNSQASFETAFFDVGSTLASTSQPVFTLRDGLPGEVLYLLLVFSLPNGVIEFWNAADDRALCAPEVILGAPHDARADMWTLGCLLYELLAGEQLFDPEFQTFDLRLTVEESHLIQMVEVFGPFQQDMLNACPNAGQWFTEHGAMRLETSYYPSTLEAILRERMCDWDAPEINTTAAFLELILRLNPKERLRASDLVNHPWFTS